MGYSDSKQVMASAYLRNGKEGQNVCRKPIEEGF